MSNSRNYTITTLRNSVRQHGSASLGGTVVANNQVPFSFSPFTARIRDSGVPYVTGPDTATDLNLRRNVPTSSAGGGGGGGASYISPFAYYDFETSGSQYVTNVLGTNNYTGSFVGAVGNYGSTSFFGFSDDFVFSGSFAMRFPQEFNERYINLGTPDERPNYSPLFSGSFSVSVWAYLEWDSGNSYRYSNTKFFAQKFFSTQGFAFGTYRGQPMFYSYGGSGGGGTQSLFTSWGNAASTNFQGWNHFVFVVDGDTDATNRRVRAYINNNDFGFADDSTAGRYFQKKFRADQQVGWGATEVGSGNSKHALDEASIWNIALSTEQVNALYNSGKFKIIGIFLIL